MGTERDGLQGLDRISRALVAEPIAGRLARSLLVARRMAARLRRRVARVGAFELPYLEGGRGEALVLVHGFSDSKDSFVDVARSLSASRRIVLPDLLGFAEASQPVDVEYSLDRFVEVFSAFVDAIGLERFDLGGNSLGGAISLAYAVRCPERVRSLSLIGSAGIPMPNPSPLQLRLEAGENPFVCTTLRDHEALLRMVFEVPPPMPRPLRLHLARQYIARAPMNAKILDDLRADPPDLTPALKDVRAPTLLLWGDRDRLIDVSAGHALHQGIPDARLVILHGIGHCPQYEVPGSTSRILHRFIARRQSFTP